MIKGQATIQFGCGSVASCGGVDTNNGVGAIFMRTVPPGKIGRGVDKVDWDFVMRHSEVTVYFTNVESLDSYIHTLQQLREQMLHPDEEVNE